ncbi:MAG TPA: hypothetical protein VMX55_13605 [candidate division Zixibacteria bacterium]|nr:hypothetical protein [candidate division Zixibacteria bacterium]
MENGFQFAMFIISPIVLILDAVFVSSGIIRKFARIEKSDESERTKLFSIVDVMEKIGIVLGVLTLMLAGYLAVKIPDEYPWLQWFNPITILFMCIIGALMTLRTLEDTPITALIALLAGFLGAAIFAVAFGDLGQGKWIYFIIFLVIDIIVFILVRTLTQQMAMIGKIMNWLPVAITIAFLCIAWGIFQIVSLAIWGVQLVLPNI